MRDELGVSKALGFNLWHLKNYVLDAQEILSLDALLDSSQGERHFLQSHINIKSKLKQQRLP